MNTSDAGLKLIRQFEGLRLKAYRCPAGIWTIGYGHTSAAGAPEVREDMRISREEAEAILKRDLAQFEDAVSSMVKVPLTENQFDTLVSFAFNCGIAALRRSTLLKRVNAGAIRCRSGRAHEMDQGRRQGAARSCPATPRGSSALARAAQGSRSRRNPDLA